MANGNVKKSGKATKVTNNLGTKTFIEEFPF